MSKITSTKLKSGDLLLIAYKDNLDLKGKIRTYKGLLLSQNNKKENRAITILYSIDDIKVKHTFLLSSPLLTSVKVLSRSKARKSKLYYIESLNYKELKKKVY